MEPFTQLTSRVVSLPVDNIDTDQIIPARFLKTTEKTGLGRSR
jgi:3-isopropylmalate/(R)-2-methylmalate dehydratase small subunit